MASKKYTRTYHIPMLTEVDVKIHGDMNQLVVQMRCRDLQIGNVHLEFIQDEVEFGPFGLFSKSVYI